jgi:FemAB family protein
VVPPVFVTGMSVAARKRAVATARRSAQALGARLGCSCVSFRSELSGLERGSASAWHHALLTDGATLTVRHNIVLDLTLGDAAIRRNLRRSYRALIGAGLDRWLVQLEHGSGANAARWSEFRALHRAAAGRVTREPVTWDLQWRMLCEGDAFLLTLSDPVAPERLVGGGFFEFSRDEAVYSVAAYDRALFHEPLGHVVQFRAIEELTRLGVRRYLIGAQPYPQDDPRPTMKELTIANFKQGFASTLEPWFVLTLPLAPAGIADRT